MLYSQCTEEYAEENWIFRARAFHSKRPVLFRIDDFESRHFSSPREFVFADFMGAHHSFITRLLRELEIRSLDTFPIKRLLKKDYHQELVFPISFQLPCARYRFIDISESRKMRQDVVFHCNFEQLKRIQDRVVTYCDSAYCEAIKG